MIARSDIQAAMLGGHFRWSIHEHCVIHWTPVRKRLTLLSCFHENAIKTLSRHFLKRP